jgi:hypothetical protein
MVVEDNEGSASRGRVEEVCEIPEGQHCFYRTKDAQIVTVTFWR